MATKNERPEAMPQSKLPLESLERLRRYYAEECRAVREAYRAERARKEAILRECFPESEQVGADEGNAGAVEK